MAEKDCLGEQLPAGFPAEVGFTPHSEHLFELIDSVTNLFEKDLA